MRYIPSAFLLFLFLINTQIHAQDRIELWQENQVKINVKTNNLWSFSNAISNRNFIANRINANTTSNVTVNFIGFRHFTNYKFAKNLTASLGIRYRFLRTFNKLNSNEFRFTQQLTYSKNYNTIKLSHRFRVEQRLYTDQITNRFRYRFAVKLPICYSKKNKPKFYFGANAEFLYTIAKRDFPFIDQRLTTKLSYVVFENAAIELLLNYRFRNFIYADLEHQIFLLSVFAYNFE